MDTEAIIDAAAGKQALLSAALNAKNTAASHELVARVYEKLHEIMSILEEDQKVQEVKGLLDAQPWEELAVPKDCSFNVRMPFEPVKEEIEDGKFVFGKDVRVRTLLNTTSDVVERPLQVFANVRIKVSFSVASNAECALVVESTYVVYVGRNAIHCGVVVVT
ncbi:hypothetical protein LTR49_017594 [Elasticomyces elasticus]|nr:hypothetical protein LTR49_017594 [Elasticomyces elasticus]KAK5733411.1 hypothetical protein LTS12_026946 [Elasticomyces elasticus]